MRVPANVLTFSREPREQTLNAFALAPGARIGGRNAVLGAAVSLPTFRRKPPLLHFLNPTIVFARCIVVSPNTGIRQIHVHRTTERSRIQAVENAEGHTRVTFSAPAYAFRAQGGGRQTR